jgi:hypothetical protein
VEGRFTGTSRKQFCDFEDNLLCLSTSVTPVWRFTHWCVDVEDYEAEAVKSSVDVAFVPEGSKDVDKGLNV